VTRRILTLLILTSSLFAQVKERDVRAHLGFLASDALQGRGSATPYERIGAEYIASQLRQFGIDPAGDKDASGSPTYFQAVTLTRHEFTAPPTLSAGGRAYAHGNQIAAALLGAAQVSGPLQKLKSGDKANKGAVVLLDLTEGAGSKPVFQQIRVPLQQGAVMVLVADSAQIRRRFAAAAKEPAELPMSIGGSTGPPPLGIAGTVVLLNEEATRGLAALADGAPVEFKGEVKDADAGSTVNVLGVLPGAGPRAGKENILLSAHLDHLGTDSKLNGDQIYNGADDDASGVVAVLELARALGAGPRPKRTVYFALFGSEEKGGWGAEYFLDHPMMPLESLVANLEFEMIGRPDAAVAPGTLWLTGYERTDLGPTLAKQGARIVADPHPEMQFFMRSDNYALAKRGVVAQTVSSYGLHKQYHQPDDDLAHIDFKHMTQAIDSMVKPVEWLVNGDFVPKWNEGKKP
jgi:hypothetical protein